MPVKPSEVIPAAKHLTEENVFKLSVFEQKTHSYMPDLHVSHPADGAVSAQDGSLSCHGNLHQPHLV